MLQTIYLAKFYYWEDGYMSTIDIAVDKFGFYVGWGCIAWVREKVEVETSFCLASF